MVVGSEGGQLALVNFVTGALLYTFAGWGSGVRCVVGSPALDVVGVGLADGRAALLNLRCAWQHSDHTVLVHQSSSGMANIVLDVACSVQLAAGAIAWVGGTWC